MLSRHRNSELLSQHCLSGFWFLFFVSNCYIHIVVWPVFVATFSIPKHLFSHAQEQASACINGYFRFHPPTPHTPPLAGSHHSTRLVVLQIRVSCVWLNYFLSQWCWSFNSDKTSVNFMYHLLLFLFLWSRKSLPASGVRGYSFLLETFIVVCFSFSVSIMVYLR